jgi:hypothetical protein
LIRFAYYAVCALQLAGSSPSRHPGPLVVMGLVVLVITAAIVVVLVGGDDVSPTAVRVNGTRTPSATLDGELDGFIKAFLTCRLTGEWARGGAADEAV